MWWRVNGSWWKRRYLLIFWKIVWLWRKEGNKEKEKGKEIRKEKIFSWSPKMKISEIQIPELKSSMRENISENTGYVPKSSISERPEINIKNP